MSNENIPNVDTVSATQGVENPDVSSNTPTEPEFVRPEWMPDKFKSYEELGKSYLEIEKQNSSIFGAPQEYVNEDKNFTPTPADFLLKNICKEANYSNKVYNTLAKALANEQKTIIEHENKRLEELKNEIGSERLSAIDNYFNNSGIDKTQASILKKSISTSKEQLEAIEAFIKVQTDKISSVQPIVNNNVSAVDIDKELSDIYTSKDYMYNPNKYKDRIIELANQKNKLGK